MTAEGAAVAGAPSRIEGGVDAIVVGASADGLVAAAYLARAGLKTVLFENAADIGLPVRRRAYGGDKHGVDAEHLVFTLDPQVIDDLELYRHGVSFAARRLDTVYFFDDHEALHVSGDVRNAANDIDDDDEAAAFTTFLEDVFEASSFLRPLFSGAAGRDFKKAFNTASPALARRLNWMMTASVDDVMASYLSEGRLRTAMTAETVFRTSSAPHEAMSFAGLLAKWSGEVAGLQAACGVPEGGVTVVIDALRRAAQAANVDIRASSAVRQILIEKDRAAGVSMEGGGQVRAPIVVAAGDARQVFLSLVGPGALDVAFQQDVAAMTPKTATAQLHLALRGSPRDEETRANMARRLVFAPPLEALRASFSNARQGEVSDGLIIEAIFPQVFDQEAVNSKMQILSVMAHPLPFDENPEKDRQEEIRTAILSGLEKFAPSISKRIEADQLVLASDAPAVGDGRASAFAARPGVVRQLALASLCASGGRIGGLYFCGPESQIGAGLNGAAGRNAARAALQKFTRAGGAP